MSSKPRRPKANFSESDGSLWLAKFPAKDDRYDVNPNPHKDAHRLTVDGQTQEPDIDAALACAELYRVNERRAKEVLAEVERVIAAVNPK